MKNWLKKLFKGWNAFEICFLLSSLAIILVVGITFKSWWLTIASAMLGITGCVLSAKGKVVAQFVGFGFIIVYSILSYFNGFYGEIIINVIVMLPMYVWGIISWIRHRDKQENVIKVNKIGYKEWILVPIGTVAVFVAFYFILKALDTSELFVSTLSIIGNLVGMYLLVRRSKYGFVTYLVDDVIFGVLWFIPVFRGNWNLLPIAINSIMNMISDIYGIISWTRLQKRQKEKIEQEQN